MEESSSKFIINIQGSSFELVIGESYIIHYFDEDISFNGLEAKIEDTYWQDEVGRTMFYIWIPDQQEDYLVGDDEIKEISKKVD